MADPSQQYGNVTEFADSVDLTFVFDKDTISFFYQIDASDPDIDDDVITIKSADGSYNEQLKVKGLIQEGNWIELTFPEPDNPEVKLTMEYDKGTDEKIIIFENETYDELKQYLDEEPETV